MARALLLLDALDAENCARRHESRISNRSRRALRDQMKWIELSDDEFKAHYRLSKQLFFDLCADLKPFMTGSRRKTRISVECKVLTALSFYATGSYQKPIGMSYLHGVSQPSVSNAVREVTLALNTSSILTRYIHFPQTVQERQSIINGFSNKFGFPGCLGCIDGTHIALIRPSEHEERFLNRKHYHSRNVQIICDSDLNILNIDACFGGATHDAYIWSNCIIQNHLQQLHSNGESVWLLVNAVPGTADEHYTNIHCCTRNTVERCIGIMKARWRCLLKHRVLHYDHHMVAKIINACAVLHNICNRHSLPVPELSSVDIQTDSNSQIPQPDPHQIIDIGTDQELLVHGREQRARIVHRLWSAPRSP